MAADYFIADLHLSAAATAVNAHWCDFLAQLMRHAQAVRALYILGDFFEVWLGDDDDDPYVTQMASQLQRARKYFPIFFLHGNRDFLMGETFAQRAGWTIRPSPYLLTPTQERPHPYLLLHGDCLCTDDTSYQAFRQLSREATWQTQFLAQPLAKRRHIAQQYREHSTVEKMQKNHAIMDVNAQAVLTLLAAYPAHTQLIHGHTHQPACHRLNATQQRFVLPAWENDSYGWLQVDEQEEKLVIIR